MRASPPNHVRRRRELPGPPLADQQPKKGRRRASCIAWLDNSRSLKRISRTITECSSPRRHALASVLAWSFAGGQRGARGRIVARGSG